MPALIAIVVLAGLVHAASIASPWNGQPQWWLQIASLAVLAWAVTHAGSWKKSALFAWMFAIALQCATYWWLFISMHTYGGLAAPLAALAILALAAFLGLYYAAAGAAFGAFKTANRLIDSVLFGAAWMLAELMRAAFFTGFPWGEAGYAHVDGPLAFLAPYVGVHVISFVAAALAYAASQIAAKSALRSWKYWAGIAAVCGLIAACNLPAPKLTDVAPRPRLSVLLLQGNIPQDEKFEGGTGIPLALQWYGTQMRDSKATLVVAPETAIPMLPSQLPYGYLEALADRFSKGDQAVLAGIPMGSYREGYTNSVIGFKPRATAYRYDKHHLVPFGEFIPPLFKWFTQLMNIPLGDFDRGSLTQPAFEWHGERLAPNICYEDLFGEDLAMRFADPATAPTVLVNVSNIGWFGNTIAIDQHLQISRMRSLEFDRPMLRATNTGPTVIIDHNAHVTDSLPRHTRGALAGDVEGRTSITFFASWASRLGLWPLWLLGLAVVGACAWRALTIRLRP